MSGLEKQSVDHVWPSLRRLTQARIAIGRAGDAQTTNTVLAFDVAQAQARDAVHQQMDVKVLGDAIRELGLHSMTVDSAAEDRAMYLRRPDAGGRLSEASRLDLASRGTFANLEHPWARPSREMLPETTPGITIVIGDGLSAAAPMKHAAPLLAELLQIKGVVLNPLVFVATQARVALADQIGELVQAPAVLMLIGERPGLTTPESLGAYLTWNPRVGCTNAERNCVSNIHPGGLSYLTAARKLALLIMNARKLGATGVALHDEQQADGDELDRRLYSPEER